MRVCVSACVRAGGRESGRAGGRALVPETDACLAAACMTPIESRCRCGLRRGAGVGATSQRPRRTGGFSLPHRVLLAKHLRTRGSACSSAAVLQRNGRRRDAPSVRGGTDTSMHTRAHTQSRRWKCRPHPVVHTHTHTLSHTLTHAHTQTHTDTHTRMHTHAHACTHRKTQTHRHTTNECGGAQLLQSHSSGSCRAESWTYGCGLCVCVFVCVRACACVSVCVCVCDVS